MKPMDSLVPPAFGPTDDEVTALLTRQRRLVEALLESRKPPERGEPHPQLPHAEPHPSRPVPDRSSH